MFLTVYKLIFYSYVFTLSFIAARTYRRFDSFPKPVQVWLKIRQDEAFGSLSWIYLMKLIQGFISLDKVYMK